MNKMVYSVFKAIMVSIIFVFVWDTVFYMYRVTTLNQEMESMSTSLKKVVMDNNYLPSEMQNMYYELICKMIADYNHVPYTAGMNASALQNSEDEQNFIAGFHWNYDTDPIGVGSNLSLTASRKTFSSNSWHTVTDDIVNKRMNTPGDYGDVTIVQLRVAVWQPMWGWGTPSGSYNYTGQDATQWDREANFRTQEFTYTYYVPCLNYKTINQ